MSSILNSISAGDLQVHKAPEVKPVKEDSIIDLLQSAEIELVTCPNIENSLDDVNTGFGAGNELHYTTPCSKPTLQTPLYKDNYLSEFLTEEEKAAARHALGLYNKGDVVAMSLLTAEDSLPDTLAWKNATIKQMRKGDSFFTPITSFDAVYDSSGKTTLSTKLNTMQSLMTEQQKTIASITQVSNGDTISSLGDVRKFLQGFNNGDNLHEVLDDMNQEMLRFEKTGKIES